MTASLARPKKLNPRCQRVRLTVAEEIRLMTALYALACFLWPRTFGDLNQHSEVNPPVKNGLPVEASPPQPPFTLKKILLPTSKRGWVVIGATSRISWA